VVPEGSDTTAVLNALTQAVRKYSFDRRRVPASFEEVISAGYVKSLPPAPPGKKYAINPKTVSAILIAQ
jgi:competence protein ComGC